MNSKIRSIISKVLECDVTNLNSKCDLSIDKTDLSHIIARLEDELLIKITKCDIDPTGIITINDIIKCVYKYI